MRCFISIDIPKEIKKEIAKIQDSLPEFEGKMTEIENLHLTLKFLGEIDEEKVEEVKKRLKEINVKSFKTEINSIGVFSERFIRIIWLHLTNCNELQKEIDNALKDLFELEARFMSHLTIARVKNIKDKKKFLQELEKIKILGIRFVVGGFKLKKSELKPEGPVYSVLEEYKLN